MRRLNVKLTLWLVGVTLFSVVGVHFLHGFQIDRNADVLRVQAEQARDRNDVKEAVKLYNQYLKHRDDPEGYSALAEMVVGIAKDADATRQDKIRAYNILEEAIRRHPDLDDVRRRLIEYTMEARRYPEAEEHINYLLQKDKIGTDLELKLAICYYANGEKEKSVKKLCELIGFNDKTEEFAAEPPAGAKEIGAYELLARLLRERPDGQKLAGQVMSQLVTWNPDSAKAHLTRASFLLATPEITIKSPEFLEAKKELDRAFELEPNDADVILSVATFAIGEADYDKADELLKQAISAFPDRQDCYLRMAQLKKAQNDSKGALDALTDGLKKATDTNAILEQLMELQFALNDIAATRETVKTMRERGTFLPEIIRFAEARIKFSEGNYLEASREFEAVRPAIARFSATLYPKQLELLLGRSYQMLGQSDRQLEVFRRVLQSDPTQLGARLGEAVALYALGRREQATASMELLKAHAQNYPFVQGELLQLLITDQLQTPPAQRDWKDVERIANLMYKDPSRPELENTLLKAEILALQDQTAEAAKLLTAARKEKPKDFRIWSSLAKLLVRDKRADKVPQLLNLAEKEVGDTPAMRLERIRYATQVDAKDPVAELKKLEQNLDKFTEAERNIMYAQLATSYASARDYEDAKRCAKLVAAKDPKNAQIRQFIFELAVDNKNEPDMRAAVKDIHDSRYFGALSPLYKYVASMELLTKLQIRRGNKTGPLEKQDLEDLSEARKLLDEGLANRGEWHVLWRVRGEVDQMEGNLDDAITRYQRSLECSRTGQVLTARRLVQLLHARQRFAEAALALKFVGETDSSDGMRKIIEDVVSKSGDPEAALEMAARDVERAPDNATNHAWYAQLLGRAGRDDEAEAASVKATELAPDRPEYWDLRIMLLLGNRKTDQALAVVAEAAKALAENPVALAALYERVQDRSTAEELYKSALAKKPDDLALLRRLAEFHLSVMQTEQATPYVDKIIELASKSTNKDDEAYLDWARRNKARTLVATYDYQHVMEAVKLIEQNAKDGKLSPEDIQAMYTLLSSRPEASSRARAVELLEELQRTRPLFPQEKLLLARLYDRADRWTESRELLVSAVSSKKDDPELLMAFSQMLVSHQEWEDASRWLGVLEDLVSKSSVNVSENVRKQSRALRARILAQKGEKDEAVALLEGILPRPLPQNQLYLLEQVAMLMESFELYDGAEKMLSEYISQDPRGTIAMAAFLGRRGSADKAFELLDHSRKDQPLTQIVICALEALRRHPGQATKERVDLLDQWMTEALKTASTDQKQPDNAQRLRLLQAELFELAGRYPEAIKNYREALADKSTSVLQRAIVQNNLAFVLAVKRDRASGTEAVTLSDEAIRVIGPTSDLLDTRGLAQLAKGDTKAALADFQAAIADNPSGTKYFHLAQAQKAANNMEGARDAWAKGVKAGLDGKNLTPAERDIYAELEKQLN